MKFLTRARLTGYSRVLVGFYIVFWIGWYVTSAGLLGVHDSPAGSDFLSLYAGSRLATSGDPAAAYDYARYLAAAREIIGADVRLGPWLYPPIFATMVLPFTYLPYLVAAPVWLALTAAAYLYAVGRTFPDGLTPWLAAAFLAAFDNAMGGQNGFLSAALLGFGLLGVRSSPVLGGIVLGLLVYKPQLAGLVPVALVVGGQWRALLGFAIGALGMTGISLIVVGWDGWMAFIASIPETKAMLDAGGRNWLKMPTTFVAARLLGAEVSAAQACQALVSVTALAAVIWVWWRPAPFALKAAALGVGSLLAFPYAFYYDWVVLAVAFAWLAKDMDARGIVPWQVWTMAVAWCFPLFGPIIAGLTNLQLGPVMLLAMLAVVIIRARTGSACHTRGVSEPPA